MDYRDQTPDIIRDFLTYHETIKGHSKKTVDEYYLDLRTFFRFMKLYKANLPLDTDFSTLSISDIDLGFVKSITLSDIYEYLAFLSRDRPNTTGGGSGYGLSAASRSRKIAVIRSYYKYLTVKTHQLDSNPVQDLDSPKSAKTLPRFLNLEESKQLLSSSGEGANADRDYCILTIFLNCGLRISELVGLNLTDISSDSLRVTGKGNKQRIVFINDACAEAINAYLSVRKDIAAIDKRAFFLSSRRTRMSRSTVHALVKKHLLEAGLERSKYSSHKLRHTAATLMLRNGVDVRTLQELLGHEHLNTTQIYTHVESDSLRDAAKRSPLADVKRNSDKRIPGR
ncbi:MAG: tyrosine recombinase XerC [Oscillospiraceae bacterium]|jgi:site-specific recombinase XerD|nr:tyrosine recombinase XerC [Oscillospiraceae bacterium]